MKKLSLTLVLILICSVVLCGCGKDTTPYDYDLTEYITLGSFPNTELDEEELVEQLDEAVQEITSEYKETKEITDRAVEDGDVVNIDYVGKINGEEFEGGSAEGTDLTIGSDKFIPGFEDGLIGKKLNEEVVLNLVFPEDYNEDYAGKDVEFTVKINKITAETIPALTDEMVEEKTDYTTVDEFVKETKKQLAEQLLWQEYLDSCKVIRYPEAETKECYDNVIESYSQMAVYNGMTLETMVTSQYGYESLDEFLSYAMEFSMNSVKEEMAIYLTAREYDLLFTDEEYKTLGEELAKDSGYEDLEAFEEYIGKDTVGIQIYLDKIVEKLYEASDVENSVDYDVTKDTTGDASAETTSSETSA